MLGGLVNRAIRYVIYESTSTAIVLAKSYKMDAHLLTSSTYTTYICVKSQDLASGSVGSPSMGVGNYLVRRHLSCKFKTTMFFLSMYRLFLF